MLKPDQSPSPEFKSPLHSVESPSGVLPDHPDAEVGGEFERGGYYAASPSGSEGEFDLVLSEDEEALRASSTTASSRPSDPVSSTGLRKSVISGPALVYDSYCVRGIFLVLAMATAGMGFLYSSRNNTAAAMGFWLFATALFVATFARFEKAPSASEASGLLLGGAKPFSKSCRLLGYSSAVTALAAVVAAGYFSAKHQTSMATALWGVVITAAIIAQRSLDSQSKETSSPSFGYGTMN